MQYLGWTTSLEKWTIYEGGVLVPGLIWARVPVPIFFEYENVSKNSAKNWAWTYSSTQQSCKFSTGNINFCGLCKKDKNLTDKIVNSPLFKKDRFVFFTQGAKFDIFCRKFTRVLNTWICFRIYFFQIFLMSFWNSKKIEKQPGSCEPGHRSGFPVV